MLPRRRAFNFALLECTHPGCSQTFRNKSGLMQHVRIPHPSISRRPNAAPAPEPPEPAPDNVHFLDHNQDEVEMNQARIIRHPIINGMHPHLGTSIQLFTSELLDQEHRAMSMVKISLQTRLPLLNTLHASQEPNTTPSETASRSNLPTSSTNEHKCRSLTSTN